MNIAQEAPRTREGRLKAAATAVTQIEKDHGKGAIFNLASRVGIEWPHIPTGIFEIDHDVLGIGGLPRGRIVEVYGPESGGKTTLSLQAIAQTQKLGELAAFIDAEHALDPNWAKTLGVNMNDLHVAQPDNGEQALQIAETLIESQAFSMIVVDSVAALVPKSELEGDIGDSNVGLQARLMSQAMRKLSAKVSKSNTILLFINQIREKIGVMFGSPETTTGGRALKFYASVRLDVRRIQGIKESDRVVGNAVRVKAAKNKMAAPFRESVVSLLFDRGFDGLGSLLTAAVATGVVDKSGSWYSYMGRRLGQGEDTVRELLSNPVHYDEILKETIKRLRAKEI